MPKYVHTIYVYTYIRMHIKICTYVDCVTYIPMVAQSLDNALHNNTVCNMCSIIVWLYPHM